MTLLKQDEIKEAIPHRYENLLVDEVDIDEQSETLSGTLSLTISEEDALNRQIFFTKTDASTASITVPVYAEIMALASIVSSRSRLKDGYTTIFAGIANFKRHNFHALGDTLRGKMSLVTDRKGFYKYEGHLENDAGLLCEGNLTAFYTPSENLASEKPDDLVKNEKEVLCTVSKENRAKEPCMFICDALNEVSDDGFVAQYEYPADHPIVKGHFPDYPLMMGVMQWMSVEDSFCAYLEQQNKHGEQRYKCSFKLIDVYGRSVADLTDVELEASINCDAKANQVNSLSVRKIMFKKIVNPGERFYIHATAIEAL